MTGGVVDIPGGRITHRVPFVFTDTMGITLVGDVELGISMYLTGRTNTLEGKEAEEILVFVAEIDADELPLRTMYEEAGSED